jgi:hypothetical protein
MALRFDLLQNDALPLQAGFPGGTLWWTYCNIGINNNGWVDTQDTISWSMVLSVPPGTNLQHAKAIAVAWPAAFQIGSNGIVSVDGVDALVVVNADDPGIPPTINLNIAINSRTSHLYRVGFHITVIVPA